MKLELQELCKGYGKTQILVLNHLNLPLLQSQTIALIGPSGSGKSTLIRLIAGLEKPDKGTITLVDESSNENGRSRFKTKQKPSLGMVFQAYNLFPHLTALENIVLSLKIVHGYSRAEAEERGMTLLNRFQLSEHASKKPAQLSGGQSQRVAIVRAIAHKPTLLFLDEPTSALDPLMTSEVLDLIMELRDEGNQLIVASHHLGFVKKVASDILFLANGKLVDFGPAADFFTSPRQPEVVNFFEKTLKY